MAPLFEFQISPPIVKLLCNVARWPAWIINHNNHCHRTALTSQHHLGSSIASSRLSDRISSAFWSHLLAPSLTMENDPTVINHSLQLLSTAAGTLSTSTGNAKKRSSVDKDLDILKKKLKQGTLNVIARDLVERKKLKSGRMPHNAIIDAVQL
jgi:hypothetical protein